MTVFAYFGRVRSPEWRRQRRRADLRQFYIFRHGPVIIYTRLPAGGTYYPICMFPTNSECLIGISDAFSAFVYGYPSSSPRVHCTPTKACLLCATPFIFIFNFALRPQKRDGLLGTGTEGERDERVTARPRIPPEKDRRDRGPPPEQWKC